jgi:hypothetical protein
MKADGLRAQVGYGSRPRHKGRPVGRVANVLDRTFSPEAPNQKSDTYQIANHPPELHTNTFMSALSARVANEMPNFGLQWPFFA